MSYQTKELSYRSLRKIHAFIKSHNMVNRIFDVLEYLKFPKDNDQEDIKLRIKKQLVNPYYVEDLAKYFEDKKNKNIYNTELRCSLTDLIYDLNILKIYLENNLQNTK